MKIVGQILLACIVLTLLQYAVAAALVVAVLSLMWGVYFRTQETIAFVATLLIVGLISNYPVACILVAGVAFVVIKLGGIGPGLRSCWPGLARLPAGGDFGGGDDNPTQLVGPRSQGRFGHQQDPAMAMATMKRLVAVRQNYHPLPPPADDGCCAHTNASQ